MTTETVLSEAQRWELIEVTNNSGIGILSNPVGYLEHLALAIEQAVLQSPEVQALRKDAERLDWIADQTRKSPTGTSFDYGRLVEDGLVVERGYRFMRCRFLGERLDDIRAAIDAAKEKQP